MASWIDYVSTKIRGLQYWWSTPLIDQYRDACVAKIEECKIEKTSGELIRNMDVMRIDRDNGTFKNDDEPVWFFDKNDKEVQNNLETYDGQSITFKIKSISLVNLTGEKMEKYNYTDTNGRIISIQTYKINIDLIKKIFDYLFCALEIHSKSNKEKTIFNMYKNNYGYYNGYRTSFLVIDRNIIQIILNDPIIGNIVQGYFCDYIAYEDPEKFPFHAEYAILQKYVHVISQMDTRRTITGRDVNNNSTFISNKIKTDEKGVLTPIAKNARGKSPSKKGGNNHKINFLKDFIFDPYGEDRDPVTTFMRNYESLIENEIEDADEIEKVMMYIIDPFIRKKMEEDIVIVIEKMKHMKTEMIVPTTVFMKPISAYGGKTKRHKAKPTTRRIRRTTRGHTFKQ